MDFSTIASIYWPYWLLGLAMIFATKKSEYKELMRVEIKSVVKWIIFLVFLTIYRIVMFKNFPDQFALTDNQKSLSIISWPITLLVFWEDATFGLPLLLLRKILGTRWFTFPIHLIAMLTVMFSFGLGHTYQGIGAAMLLSLYVPASVSIGGKRGFGTVMINHTLYDLATIVFMICAMR